MEDKHSSEPIPEGWEFVTKMKKDGSQISYYTCRKTGQRFYTYQDVMRYVKYAKAAGLPIYLPNFDFRRKKKSGQSSASAPNHFEESLDSEKEKETDIENSLDSEKEKETDIEKSLDSEKEKETDNEQSMDSEKDNDSDTEKSMDWERGSIINRCLDSEKDTGPGKSEFPKNDPIENSSSSQLDPLPSIFEFMAYSELMQISSEQPPLVEIPTFVPDTFPSESGLNAGLEPMQISSEQAPVESSLVAGEISGRNPLL